MLTKQELELLKKCDGIHNTLDELFKCESCAILFNEKDEE